MKSRRKIRNRKQFRKKTRFQSNRIKGRGIVRINSFEEKSAFNTFLLNSQVKIMTNGANGIIFKLTINDIEKSTYISTNVDTYGSKVDTILLKFIFLKKNEDDDYIYIDVVGKNTLTFKLATTTECYEEINIQKCIYSKTNAYLEPICPAIVFDELLVDEMSTIYFLNKFLTRVPDVDTPTISIILDILSKISTFNLCIFAMEFAGGYEILRTHDPYIYKEMSMFLLLELALKIGYSHADFHRGNIMINKTSDTYFSQIGTPLLGKPLLIDFGLSAKIPRPVKRMIQELCELGKYTKALNVLCTVSRKDGTKVIQYPAYYGWACGSVIDTDSIEVIENRIQQEVQLKEDQSQKLIELLLYQQNIIEETRKTFRVLLNNNDELKMEIKKQKREYYQINEMPDAGLEGKIINNLYQLHYFTEKNKNENEIQEIKEQIKTDVLEEIADIRNLRFPENTDRHIGALFDQRRLAEIELETTFKIRYPDGPDLPQPITYCNL